MMFAVLIVVFFGLLLLTVRPLGGYMARLFSGERVLLSPVLAPVERLVYRVTAVDPRQEQGWKGYAVGLLLFNLLGLLAVYALQRVQGGLPLNPEGLPGVGAQSSFNTAASFTTNTNWQGYYPEATMSYLTQTSGLAVQNFVSAATGIAVAVALIRGFSRRSTREVGNFWVDMTRAVLYVLLPVSLVAAVAFVAAGVPQTFGAYREVVTLAGETLRVPLGPVASQEAIKMFGTNGGGFLNANSAHPFENPSGLTNLIQMLLIFAIPAALTYTFGRMVGNTKQGWAILAAMSVLFFAGVAVTTIAEQAGNPVLTSAGASPEMGVDGLAAPGGNMEGKELRFGIRETALFSVITTAASCGAVNGMLDSFTPLGGMIPLANIALGEVIFGGAGAGLYGILVYAIVTIFIAGLLVGRTPEYLGKKVEPFDVKMAMLTLLVIPLVILGFAGVALASDDALASRLNPAAHGLTEILYAFTSAAGNNGSAFAGISASVPFFNIALGIAMLAGRFLMIVPILALAGHLAAKGRTEQTAGTFPTTGGLWVGLLVGVILILGALTYFPSYALGPVIEHFQMRDGTLFGL
ncbi:MAG TPA: potassium-transporting ATPase subunit KdpA [Thermomicrobiales bacterium]|jgi:K+-transporting ATPase ATPase A chain|nr:potassium-transporting ATPase subunit KdpA [Thermomicrobiales bacterium]